MTVYLVGAGPGDPGLLTVRGAELLARANVVVHDRLADPSLLALAPAVAERVDVGKSPGAPVAQDDINGLLVARARAGQAVVRLKGGDPFVFGRGGEEAQALLAAGVDFEVVPGVTAAVAVAAYAGVPLTHRGLAASFTVVTGHSRHTVDHEVDWEALAKLGGTVVVLMGVAHRADIARRLIAGGMAQETPVLAVRWGTRPAQRSVRTNLATLGETALEPPATIVIGAVAGLELDWFENRPLFGRKVVVTRSRNQAPALVERLRSRGAEAVELAVIETREPADGGQALRAAAEQVGTYDWVIFTSANAVDRFMALLRDGRELGAARLAAIGPGTAGALADRSLVADLVPERFVAEALLDVFPAPGKAGRRVLLPRAAVARDVLPEGLSAMGWEVHVVEAYRTGRPRPTPDAVALLPDADAVAFTSSSTVTGFLEVAGLEAMPPMVVCIGPVTAATARHVGVRVDVVAEEHTLDGLVAALVSAFANRAPGRAGPSP